MMAGPVYEYLSGDHARLDALLRQSVARPDEIEPTSYAQFRAGLLRHIGMEERILFPAARRLNGGEPLPAEARLHRDHAALAALLVPTPTLQITGIIQEILEKHNAVEESFNGLYEKCERLARGELDSLVERLRAAPEVSVAPYSDGPKVHQHIQTLLEAARRSTDV